MRLREVLSEATRNLASGTTHAILLAAALGAVCSGLAVADARSIVTIQQTASEYAHSGASVRVLSAEGSVDAVTCERLADATGIAAAGALAEADPIALTALPRSPISSFRVTPGFAELLNIAPASSDGVWVSSAAARTLGVSTGATLLTEEGAVRVAGTYDYPEDGRDVRLALAILRPTATVGEFDECWAQVWPNTDTADGLIRSATFVTANQNEPLTISQLNKNHGATFDGEGVFQSRVTKWSGAASAVVGIAFGAAAVRRRRVEYAAALHAGQPRSAQLLTVLVETFVWAALAGALGLVAACAGLAVDNPDFSWPVYLQLSKIPLAASGSTAIGALIGSVTIRERHLFRYFKSR